jgi:hypothetical protein
VSAPFIKNILLLDDEGKRVAVKYYSDDWPTLASKLSFEKSTFTKTQRTGARAEGLGFLSHYRDKSLSWFAINLSCWT